ncbi:MAG: hypothetical protein IT208_19210 [Chthonomonadales bacterium]|nr:hypothetical protein [Chthonomonadales bacterium]
MRPKKDAPGRYYLDVVAAYNRQDLPLPAWRAVPLNNIREVAVHPYLLARLAEQDSEDILMDLYVARRRWMQ